MPICQSYVSPSVIYICAVSSLDSQPGKVISQLVSHEVKLDTDRTEKFKADVSSVSTSPERIKELNGVSAMLMQCWFSVEKNCALVVVGYGYGERWS